MVKSLLVGSLLAFCLSGQLKAEETLPSLDAVKWAGSPISTRALRGKTVVLLVYAKWCPKCNAWSGDLFAQLKDAIRDKPVVVLAINADSSPAGVKQYLAQREFFAPNIVHGYDPMITKQIGLESNLFYYAIYGPDGLLIDSGSAGSAFVVGKVKNYVLPETIKKSENLGTFQILHPKMSEEMKNALWPAELRDFTDKSIGEVQKKLTTADRAVLDAALRKCLDKKLQHIQALSEGTAAEQFDAYEEASLLAAGFKTKDQGKKAKELLVKLTQDKEFQRELAAKRNYEKTLQIIAAKPARREQLLQGYCKRFEGTHFAGIAKRAMDQDDRTAPFAEQ